MSVGLSEQESLRYSRHLLLKQIGEAGQLALKNAHVLIVGAGGLGAPASLYLAAAGVGRLTIVDPDSIEVSNLQRQILYKTNHQGRSKALTASAQLQALNTQIKVVGIEQPIQQVGLPNWLADVDLVLDCTDNADSRYYINQACQQHKVALISAAAIRGEGQFVFFNFKQQPTPCYQCIFPDLADPNSQLNCSNSGVLGPLLGVMGSLQALEAIKYLTGQQARFESQLLTFDAWQMQFNSFKLGRDPDCAICCHH
ncbi:HesA/MoeB/ThiF family protein [Gayadomonas joobiniege]|uniref:HesA/MoeB/ThiF family protein n=1 Tax=Gayadomonas joobiniege TaxID=1234606 RepID=UPI00037E0650|nr:HesA/MoeB/ThiF family protein [Gayadomonas joobiniege]